MHAAPFLFSSIYGSLMRGFYVGPVDIQYSMVHIHVETHTHAHSTYKYTGLNLL